MGSKASEQDANLSLRKVQSSLRSAHRSPINCMFLCNFEMKKGNVLVWSCHSDTFENKVNLEDIEFKTLPSGVHEVMDDVINFVIPKGDAEGNEHYNGVAYFRQNGQELTEGVRHIERSKVKMYALGVVVDFDSFQNGINKDERLDWKADEFSSANEYVDDLETLLSKWLENGALENFEPFERFFKTYGSGDMLESQSPVLTRLASAASTSQQLLGTELTQAKPHMLEYTLFWLRRLGPLIFPLWKSCLLNERLLILNPAGGSFEVCNALCYCLTIICLLPKGLGLNRNDYNCVRPLYTVGICDIDKMSAQVLQATSHKKKATGFIACTSDEILLSKPELFDKVLKIPAERENDAEVSVARLYSNSGEIIQATPHDLHCSHALFKELFGEELSLTEEKRFLQMVEPVTWSQYIIDGFYWWATAGTIKPSYYEETSGIPAGPVGESELALILGAVEYFHSRTLFLFQKLKELFETKEVCGSDDVINLPSASLVAMNLDSFSAQDHRFVEKMARLWFRRNLQVTGDLYGSVC